MQIQAAVGRVAVQVEGDSHEGDLHHHERHEHVLPEAKIQNSIEKIDVHCGYLRSAGRDRFVLRKIEVGRL